MQSRFPDFLRKTSITMPSANIPSKTPMMMSRKITVPSESPDRRLAVSWDGLKAYKEKKSVFNRRFEHTNSDSILLTSITRRLQTVCELIVTLKNRRKGKISCSSVQLLKVIILCYYGHKSEALSWLLILNQIEPHIKASTLEEYQKSDKGTCTGLMKTVLGWSIEIEKIVSS